MESQADPSQADPSVLRTALPAFIMLEMPNTKVVNRFSKLATTGLLTLLLAVLSTWLAFTPPGLDGKLHAAGYSVCHQLDIHSYEIGGVVLPLCARCTGTFLGLFISLTYLSTRGKRSGFPSKPKIAVLVLFFLFFAVDGINSTLAVIPGLSLLYEPSNLLRLSSGFLMGITLANLVMALWNQTLWADSDPTPLLREWKQIGLLIAICAAAGALIIADIDFLYYPVAILSVAGIFMVLSMVYSLLWTIILKQENTLHLSRDGLRIFIMGITTAILQIGAIDLLRYSLSGTWYF
jgi:uncharacterized membrane protein